jgi:hypothetical protein
MFSDGTDCGSTQTICLEIKGCCAQRAMRVGPESVDSLQTQETTHNDPIHCSGAEEVGVEVELVE